MIRSEEKDLRDALVYDVAVKGNDANFWDVDTGTLSVASNKLRVSNASTSSYSQYVFGDFEFAVNFPDSDAAGIGPQIVGLRNIGDSDNRGAAFFQMDTEFYAVSYDDFGTRQRTQITFNDWDDAQHRFRIMWEPDGIKFLVNDSVVATHTTSYGVSGIPQALRLDNDSATNLDVGFVAVRNSRKVI